jgi:hypothetical protein
MSYIYSNIGVTRVSGDAMGVDVMDIGIRDNSGYSSLGTIISTGIGKEIACFKIAVQSGATIGAAAAVNLCGTQTKDQFTGVVTPGTSGSYTTVNSEIQSGGVVEAILKVLAQKVTVLAYQVGNGLGGSVAVDGGSTVLNQISVVFEQQAAWSASLYGQSGGGNSNVSGMIAPTNDYGLVVADLQSAIQALGSSVGLNGTDVRQTIVVNAGTTATAGGEALLTAGQFGSSITLA